MKSLGHFQRLFSWMNNAKKEIGYFALRELMLVVTAMAMTLFVGSIVAAIQRGSQQDLIWSLLGYGGIIGIAMIVRIITHNYSFQSVRHRLDTLIRDDIILEKFLNAHPQDIETYGTGRLLSLYHKDANIWIQASLRALQQLIIFGGIFGTAFYFVYSIKSWLMLFMITGLIILTIVTVAIANRLSRGNIEALHAIVKEWDRLSARVLMSHQSILHNNTQSEVMKEQKQITQKHSKLFAPFSQMLIFGSSFVTLCSAISYIILAYTLGIKVLGDISHLPTVVSILTFYAYFNGKILTFFDFSHEFATQNIHIQQSWKILDGLRDFTHYTYGKPLQVTEGKIELKNISFSYDMSGPKVINRLCLTIQPGKHIALVGPSGGGKSTLIKILAGFLSPVSGKMLVDSQDISDFSLRSYFPHIGYLAQEPMIFDASIRDNLIAGLLISHSNIEIATALKNAECDFVFDLPEGMDTQIGERGVRLSGGQKQRIAIAKIWLKNPAIILLDEPTSALDSLSEHKISQSLEKLFIGKTVIVIAHRLQTVHRSDEILYMENGEILERGTHESLSIKSGGKYREMLDLQSGF